MRVRNIGPAILAFGILIGAGGCSADSPTSPLVPSTSSAAKGGVKADTTASFTTQGGAYAGSGGRTEATATGAYAGSGG